MALRLGSRFEVSAWGSQTVSKRTDSLKDAVEAAAKLSKGGGVTVVVTDTVEGRVRAFGHSGEPSWAVPCGDCAGVGCKRCLNYGFLKSHPVDWSN